MRVRAIRRFNVRPVLPEVLKPLGDLARNLRWAWHSDTQDLFRSVDPQLWDSSGHDPIRLLADVSVERLQMLSKDKKFLKNLQGHPGRPRRLPDRRSVVPGLRGREPGRAEGHRLLLARVRHHRGAAAVLRRAGHPGRRPPEGGQRPRRADHRRRPALPAGLLPPVVERGRLAAGALPAPRPQCAAADAAARRRRPGPDRRAAGRSHACSPRSGWRRSAGCRC